MTSSSRILSDFHMHSSFSADSSTPMEEQVKAAMARGLSSICFTEHLDLDWPYDNSPADGSDETPFVIDYEAYRGEFQRLQGKYQAHIQLYFGLELGLNLQYQSAIRDYLDQHPDFDFIIGSTHSSRHMDPYYPTFFDGITVEEALRRYFTDALQNVQAMPWFDSYGHLDYILRYAMQQFTEKELRQLLSQRGNCSSTPHSFSDWAYENNRDLIDEILQSLIANHIALEVNTQPLKRGFPETNPGKAILRKYRELGGDLVTVGADAHRPDSVGFGLDAVADLLRACGFTSYVTYSKRQSIRHPL